jgi:signal transduction histidine kinase
MKKFSWSLIIMILLLFTIMFFSVIYFSIFSEVKTDLKKETFNYVLHEVGDFSKNIEEYNKKTFGDLKRVLKNSPEARNIYNDFLSTFITTNFKNIFLVYKDKNSKFFRVLADGSKNPSDRFDFDEKFEPKFRKKWEEVLIKKRPVYFKNSIEGIWYTYLYPVVKDSTVDYIIVIDFSTKPVSLIEKNLKSLQKLFTSFIFIVMLIVVSLAVFIIYDIKRQNRMKELLSQVQKLNKTLQKRVEEEVAKSREKDKQLIMQSRMALMGELLSMIAHQWRQPLNVIGGIVSNLELDLTFDELDKKKLKEYTEKIKSTIKYLSQTIDDFRKFYRKDTIKESADVNELIKEVLNLIKPSLENKKIDLKLELKCKSSVKLLKNEFKQVILNIVKNAEDILVEREVKNPYIFIKAEEIDGNCIIEIKDNGGGVDLKIKDEIFKPYFTTKDEKNGTGLGLYMSKNIVENRLNGELSVYNDNEGAVFKIVMKVDDGYKRNQENN